MKSEGYTMPGGPLNVRHLPIPIGPGIPHVTPKPAPTPRATKPTNKPAVTGLGPELVQAYENGATAKEITSRYGVHRSTLYDALKAAGVPTRRATS